MKNDITPDAFIPFAVSHIINVYMAMRDKSINY